MNSLKRVRSSRSDAGSSAVAPKKKKQRAEEEEKKADAVNVGGLSDSEHCHSLICFKFSGLHGAWFGGVRW